MIGIWRRLATTVNRRPARVLAVVALIVLVLAVGLPRLEFVTSQDTLVDSGSEVYRDNARYQSRFGGEPMMVLLTGDLRDVTRPEALAQIRDLEEELRATGEFANVVGPATALDFAVGQLSVAPQLFTAAAQRDATAAAEDARTEVADNGGSAEQQAAAADEAATQVEADSAAAMSEETTRLSAAGEQSLDNPDFVEFLLYDANGDIRPGLRDNFLDGDHALLLVRLPGNASIEEQANGADVVEKIVSDYDIPGVETLASGPPVLLAEINDYLQGGMATLGALAVGVMIVLLLLVFRARWPLLPLLVVLVGTIGAFGAVGLFDIPLTLVTISGLPIFIGLGVDFAIQMHNRYEEEERHGQAPEVASRRTYDHMATPLTIAMVAAVAGFLALQSSPVPMLKQFGQLLSVGVVVLVATALVTVVAALLLRDRRGVRPPRAPGRAVDSAVRTLSSLPTRAALPLLVVGAVITVAGLTLERDLPIQTDPDKWVDQQGAAVESLEGLREGTGYSSELSILVEADDVTDGDVAAWMQQFGETSVERHPALLRATSMTGLATGVHGTTPGGDDVPMLLSVAPEDAARALISDDHKSAALVFPIAPVSLQERERILDEMAASLRGDDAPPEGVEATAAGLAVVGVELVNGLEAGRSTMSLLALGLVLVWLLVSLRSLVRALLVLAPVCVAVGLSSLAIKVLGIELTPLTTVAGPLVIAVGTEFSVLVVSRYVEERQKGRSPSEAARQGVSRIGRAFVASGLTLVGGFGVMAFSPMPLLMDFGIVIALDVLFALFSTLVLLPPLIVSVDDHGWLRWRTTGPEAAPAAEVAEPAEPEATVRNLHRTRR